MINETEFNKLSDSEKRIAIAQDVIDRLNVNKLIPSYTGITFKFEELPNGEESFKDAINENVCIVCAKGALIASWIGNFNKYGFEYYGQFSTNLSLNNSFPVELVELFGREQLDLIEYAYEGTNYSWYCNEIFYSKKRPSLDYRSDLRAIMENIIENFGTFVPKLQ